MVQPEAGGIALWVLTGSQEDWRATWLKLVLNTGDAKNLVSRGLCL